MIKVANIELIRKLHYVKKIKSIDLGYSRQTIRKTLKQNEIILYTRTASIKSPAIDAFKPLIIIWKQKNQMTTALLNRLTLSVHILDMNRESERLWETLEYGSFK